MRYAAGAAGGATDPAPSPSSKSSSSPGDAAPPGHEVALLSVAIQSQPLPHPRAGAGAASSRTSGCSSALPGSSSSWPLWEIGSRPGTIDRAFFGRPTGIIEAGIKEVQTPRFWGDFFASVSEFALGYLLAIVLGVPIGLAAGRFRRLQYALDPWLNFFNSLPRIALLPVLVIMFGVFGPGSKIAVVFLGRVLLDRHPDDAGRAHDVTGGSSTSPAASTRRSGCLFRSVVIPSTVPFIITGLRLGIARALIGVVTAELYTQTEGIGVLIRRATELRQGDRALFGVLLFTISGIVGVEAIRRVEARFQKWRPQTSLERR